ncbi:NAD-dependent epimerase/dehydratase family protein [Mucilaginibacter terrenus]|uniref:NAD-dependent epimerase/dehydratase family protein n=1 Tax=Mucilaginibacter terrenus TaxID=2482727 RepID=A0A3E2NR30_9SPHI|nr:SDR family oxidoreductase [Mucilaginibacter terrenus]RFZ83455.1 NAD-dependent epimerase/dehydratase family protein [Mucilaginibacter terrenus]
MKIAVFGATGATGFELVKQALELHYEVYCLVRNKLAINHQHVQVIYGSIDNLTDVEQSITGCEAVISVLGSAPKFFGDKSTDIYSKSASVIVKAMEGQKIKKLIFCTSAGVENDPTEIWFYKHFLKPFLLKKSYDDMAIAESTIKASSLDWVLVRPSRLIDGVLTKKFRVSKRFRPEGGSKIARADLAFFLLDNIGNNKWVHQTPTLTY